MLTLLLYFMTSRSYTRQVPGELLALVGITVAAVDIILAFATLHFVRGMVEILSK